MSGLFDGILGVHAVGVASMHSLVPGDACLLHLGRSSSRFQQPPIPGTTCAAAAKLHYDTGLQGGWKVTLLPYC